MNLEHATPELLAALAKSQGAIENAHKNAKNPHFRSTYADLAEVLNTVRPVLAENGLSVLQSTAFDGERVSVTTALCHASGGYITSTAACVPAKTDAQGIGAATTYLRRYSLAAMAGIAQEDDDGQSARHDAAPAAQHSEWLERIAGISDEVEAERVRKELKDAFSGTPPRVLVTAWQAAAKKVAA